MHNDQKMKKEFWLWLKTMTKNGIFFSGWQIMAFRILNPWQVKFLSICAFITVMKYLTVTWLGSEAHRAVCSRSRPVTVS